MLLFGINKVYSMGPCPYITNKKLELNMYMLPYKYEPKNLSSKTVIQPAPRYAKLKRMGLPIGTVKWITPL
jgi:hypothetical protein